MNPKKSKKQIPAEIKKYIKDVANFLPKEKLCSAQRVMVGSGAKVLGLVNKTDHKDKVDSRRKYYVSEPFSHNVNHERRLTKIYLEQGWDALQSYCDKALAKVNVKTGTNDQQVEENQKKEFDPLGIENQKLKSVKRTTRRKSS